MFFTSLSRRNRYGADRRRVHEEGLLVLRYIYDPAFKIYTLALVTREYYSTLYCKTCALVVLYSLLHLHNNNISPV